jgi:hypothetical protein
VAKALTKQSAQSEGGAKGKIGKRARAGRKITRTLDAMPDTLDFRDEMYVPALIEVPATSDLDAFRRVNLPVLDQG